MEYTSLTFHQIHALKRPYITAIQIFNHQFQRRATGLILERCEGVVDVEDRVREESLASRCVDGQLSDGYVVGKTHLLEGLLVAVAALVERSTKCVFQHLQCESFVFLDIPNPAFYYSKPAFDLFQTSILFIPNQHFIAEQFLLCTVSKELKSNQINQPGVVPCHYAS